MVMHLVDMGYSKKMLEKHEGERIMTMSNFFKVTNEDNKQIIVITDMTLEQVKTYYAGKHIKVYIEHCVPTKEEVLQAVPLYSV